MLGENIKKPWVGISPERRIGFGTIRKTRGLKENCGFPFQAASVFVGAWHEKRVEDGHRGNLGEGRWMRRQGKQASHCVGIERCPVPESLQT